MDYEKKDQPDKKRPPERTATNNYRPTICLPMM